MHPQLGPWSTWTVLAIVATLVATATAVAIARRRLPLGLLAELGAASVLAGWLGAKIAHVLFEAKGHALHDGSTADGVLDLLRDDPWHWARLLDAGHVFYGGVVGGAAFGVVFALRRGLRGELRALCDAAAVGVLVGAAIGRVGCFLGGCCYGAASTVPWAVTYPAGHETGGVPVHPVPLYDSAAAVALAVVVVVVARRAPAGVAACVGAAAYAVARALTELVRADPERGFVGPLSTSQAISIIVVVAALLMAWRWRRS